MQTVYLSEYQVDWPKQFQGYKQKISQAFDEVLPLRIEHIGSTSIIGMMAKPTIDIQVGVEQEGDLDKLIKPMQTLGFTYNSTWNEAVPFRRFFQHLESEGRGMIPFEIDDSDKVDLRSRFVIKANIHCVPIDSEWWQRHLQFRDILRTNPKAFDLYLTTKKELAKKEWKVVSHYAEAKSRVIEEVMGMG